MFGFNETKLAIVTEPDIENSKLRRVLANKSVVSELVSHKTSKAGQVYSLV